ncbi:MAG: type II toxin-antitoxin system RelE/ParE family toxin [Oscillospiraceae bacterium]|nr:type II toxin-antitoxin system RelE/ParE family toxin [Oscillospiraceae bacterium]
MHYSLMARQDLDSIWDFYLNEYQNVNAAVKIINAITADIDQLVDYPELGPLLSSITDLDAGYRFLVTGDYLSFYRIDGSAISIDRILYGRRDYLRILIEDMFENT